MVGTEERASLIEHRNSIEVGRSRALGALQKAATPAATGVMLFLHGSTHEWHAGQPPLDLIITVDDATSEICSGFLVEEEGTASSFRGWPRIAKKGLFLSLYADGGSDYFVTPKAGGSSPTAVATTRGSCRSTVSRLGSHSPAVWQRSEPKFG
jgi:hypothetical protein